LIPPLLGFYAKFFVLSSLSTTSLILTFIAIITSIISCARYLNIIQLSNFYFNISQEIKILPINGLSYIISISTTLLILGIMKPIYLISLLVYIS
jgi:NADH:ubiquinone oxidoreductase subunit 2 (subunit N)